MSTKCIQPWYEMQIKFDNEIRFCCPFGEAGMKWDFDKPFSLFEHWNSEQFQEVRGSISNPEYFDAKCPCPGPIQSFPEPQDYWTEDQIENLNNTRENFLAGNTVLTSYPLKYYINFGLNCQLDCIMCSQTGGRNKLKASKGLENARIPDGILEPLNEHLKHALSVEIVGGEPLLIPSATRFIQSLSEDETTNATLLEVTTNGFLIERHLDLFKGIPNIRIKASIDSIEDGYELIRKGGTWDVLVKNIDAFTEMGQKLGLNWSVDVWCVLMKSSLKTLPDLIEWTIDRGLPINFIPLNPISEREWLNEDITRNPALLPQVMNWLDLLDQSRQLLEDSNQTEKIGSLDRMEQSIRDCAVSGQTQWQGASFF